MTHSVRTRSVRSLLTGMAMLLVAAALFSGCVGDKDVADTRIISVSGSTTNLPIAQAVAELYMDIHQTDEILVSGGGSGVGIRAVGEGTADIGMSSRDIRQTEIEQYPDLVEHVIAYDGIGVIVNPENPVSSLTLDQIKAIYKGEITNWREIDGNDRQIVVVGRDSASGTREFFYEEVMNKEEFVRTQQELNSNGAIRRTIQQTPDAIGYVGLGYVDDTVRGINIWIDDRSVAPTVSNVADGTYPIARSLYMYTRGEASGLVKDYLHFLLSDDGQAIVAREGFVPIR
ncbi:MAG: phosphate ABC transporter substrate-binding protein [Methanocalculus sp. MSAO_Arc2]|uniref:phosphate ABC transporter substrate-binding protein n=1 Tax=Methanocalculus sp. MSAO_Arc2 TaxID=2293855 RepID=UPI000FEF4795|nr:MAG: phosphate ABC transporter substrate-binding protein [Methanocalculus sp. MSAO_Arc2]